MFDEREWLRRYYAVGGKGHAKKLAHDRRWRDERQAMLDQIKLQRGCIDCGYNRHPAALDFDHRNPEDKLFAISRGIRYALERLMAEIEKCDVRCANCHRERTVERHGHLLRTRAVA